MGPPLTTPQNPHTWQVQTDFGGPPETPPPKSDFGKVLLGKCLFISQPWGPTESARLLSGGGGRGRLDTRSHGVNPGPPTSVRRRGAPPAVSCGPTATRRRPSRPAPQRCAALAPLPRRGPAPAGAVAQPSGLPKCHLASGASPSTAVRAVEGPWVPLNTPLGGRPHRATAMRPPGNGIASPFPPPGHRGR